MHWPEHVYRFGHSSAESVDDTKSSWHWKIILPMRKSDALSLPSGIKWIQVRKHTAYLLHRRGRAESVIDFYVKAIL